MSRLFDLGDLEVYDFDSLPLDQQMWLVDEKWISAIDAEFRGEGAVHGIAPGTWAIANSRNQDALTITLYNMLDRHHRIQVVLPKAALAVAVGRASYDVDPFVFVRSDHFAKLHVQRYAAFALVDAINVKKLMTTGALDPERLLALRRAIDEIARDSPDVGFVSFADSLLLKSDWTFGDFERGVDNTYAPENLLRVLPRIRSAFRDAIGLEVYAIMTQGANVYDEERPLHVSPEQNHVSLNTLGLAFTQLMTIDEAVRSAIRNGTHSGHDLYLDSTVFYSLRMPYHVRDNLKMYAYASRLSQDEKYVCAELDETLRQISDAEAKGR